MQANKWGNNLAVRLSAAVVSALNLKEGDEVTIEAADARHFRLARDLDSPAALQALRRLGWILPPDVRLSRDEANARGE